MLLRTFLSSAALISAVGFGVISLSPADAVAAGAGTYNWTGWYGGVSGGLMSMQSTVHDGYDAQKFNLSGAGGIFGGDVGYNVSDGHFVYGFEADASLASAGQSVAAYDTYYETEYDIATHISALATLRGRLGFVSGNSLFYVTGGLALANLKTSASWPDWGDDGYSGRSNGWKSGWVVGGGVEHALSSTWTARFEGLYADLGKQVNPDEWDYLNTFDTTALIVRGGLSHKF